MFELQVVNLPLIRKSPERSCPVLMTRSLKASTHLVFYLFGSQMHLDLKLINPLSLRDSNINQLRICCIY